MCRIPPWVPTTAGRSTRRRFAKSIVEQRFAERNSVSIAAEGEIGSLLPLPSITVPAIRRFMDFGSELQNCRTVDLPRQASLPSPGHRSLNLELPPCMRRENCRRRVPPAARPSATTISIAASRVSAWVISDQGGADDRAPHAQRPPYSGLARSGSTPVAFRPREGPHCTLHSPDVKRGRRRPSLWPHAWRGDP